VTVRTQLALIFVGSVLGGLAAVLVGELLSVVP
jgi:hypothetical protein